MVVVTHRKTYPRNPENLFNMQVTQLHKHIQKLETLEMFLGLNVIICLTILSEVNVRSVPNDYEET